ncbi:hypothetical protein D3C72_1497020 [compost metagenome]
MVVFAKAPTHIQVRAEIGLAHVGGGQAGERNVCRALGDHIDAAADAAARAHAVGQGTRAFEHFNTLDHLQRNAGGRRQAEQTVHADVAVGHRKAPHLKVVAKATARSQCAH